MKNQIKLKDNIDVKSIHDELDKLSLWKQAYGILGVPNGPNSPWLNASSISLVSVERPDLKYTSACIPTIPHSDPEAGTRTSLKECLLPGMFMVDSIDQFPNTQKFLIWFINEYQGEIGRVMLYNLPPKLSVGEHSDKGIYFKDKDRFHVVISGKYIYTTNRNNKEQYNEGDLWWFNNKVLHKSYNNGTIVKISLVFDVYKSNWRKMV
jgi:quercetin dioxygenase-like cupin family protein